jgi:hypothetical protein
MKFNIKDFNYLGIILALVITIVCLFFERQGQISVCYDVFENIISKEKG